jgi:glucokinase
VVTHTLPALRGAHFMQYFKKKGRFSDLMERIPIHVITTRAALVGAADYGLWNSMPQATVT